MYMCIYIYIYIYIHSFIHSFSAHLRAHRARSGDGRVERFVPRSEQPVSQPHTRCRNTCPIADGTARESGSSQDGRCAAHSVRGMCCNTSFELHLAVRQESSEPQPFGR